MSLNTHTIAIYVRTIKATFYIALKKLFVLQIKAVQIEHLCIASIKIGMKQRLFIKISREYLKQTIRCTYSLTTDTMNLDSYKQMKLVIVFEKYKWTHIKTQLRSTYINPKV